MPRSLRLSPAHFVRVALALLTCTMLFACASQSESEWKGDDGGYGGTGRFNPVGAEAGASDSQYDNIGKGSK